MFLTLLITAGSSSFAQLPRPERPEGEDKFVYFSTREAKFNIGIDAYPDELIQKARSALNLSDVQINALKTLLTMRQQTIEQTLQSGQEAHAKLEELLKQTNPNPTDVGTAFLATRSVEDRVKALEEKFRTDFRAALSADQRATLDRLKAASEQVTALEEIGLIERAFPHGFPMPFSTIEPGPGFAIGIHRELSNDR
jgi:uncharacterized membrane protein